MLEEEKSLIEDRERWRREAIEAEVLRLKDQDKRYHKINKWLKYLVVFQAILLVISGIGYLIYMQFKAEQPKPIIKVEEVKLKDQPKLDKKDKVIFSIQISTYRNVSLEEFREKMVNIGQYTFEDLKQFTLGEFESYTDATEFLKRVRKIGLPDAFIVATYNDQRIPITEAINMSNDQRLERAKGAIRDAALESVKMK